MNNAVSDARGSIVPKVLLADTNRWALAARLAVALAESGCEVYAICPAPHHALMKTRAVRRVFRYGALRPVEAIEAAIEAVHPDLVVPSCDRSAEHLHELYAKLKARNANHSPTLELIERSLGWPGSYSIVSSRFDLLSIAGQEGVRIPTTHKVESAQELNALQGQETMPWVLKANGTWGGVGVRVIHSAAEIEPAWRELTRVSRFTRAIKRLTVNRDPFLMRTWWRHVKREIIVQSYVQGRPANCTVFACEGKVLAMIGVEVVNSEGATGPASIVRVVENDQMRFAAAKIASRLKLSGFFGLDFMIEEGTDHVYLIEMNPRLTPPCHLRLGKGRDLVGALWALLTSQPIAQSMPVTDRDLIAYHPRAVAGKSGMDAKCYVDMPHGEPELERELLNPFPDRTLLFRLAQRMVRARAIDRDFDVSTNAHRGQLKASGLPQDLP